MSRCRYLRVARCGLLIPMATTASQVGTGSPAAKEERRRPAARADKAVTMAAAGQEKAGMEAITFLPARGPRRFLREKEEKEGRRAQAQRAAKVAKAARDLMEGPAAMAATVATPAAREGMAATGALQQRLQRRPTPMDPKAERRGKAALAGRVALAAKERQANKGAKAGRAEKAAALLPVAGPRATRVRVELADQEDLRCLRYPRPLRGPEAIQPPSLLFRLYRKGRPERVERLDPTR